MVMALAEKQYPRLGFRGIIPAMLTICSRRPANCLFSKMFQSKNEVKIHGWMT